MTAQDPILFDRNENRFGPAPACMDVLRQADAELMFNYTRAFQQGNYSDLSVRLGLRHGVDEKRIILGYGCEDILKEAVHYFLKPGRTILIPSASWWYYTAIANEVEGITVQFPLIEQPTTYTFDVDALIGMKDEHDPGMVLIASPNNPTGNALSREDLLRVLEAYRDTPVLLDQAYFGLVPGEDDDFSQLTDSYLNLLILRTFSKLYALAGMRIGYGIIGEGMGWFQKFCGRNLGYNRLSEKLALAALDSVEYYTDIARRMADDRAAFTRLLRSYEGCRVFDSAANFLLVRFPDEVAPVLKEALDRQGLMVKFFQEPGFLGYARISLGTDPENARLREAIGQAWPAVSRRAAAGGEVA
ncbi:histidinol-phosphate aminotransferase family protein [bacterium]|nr:MAG: histidinol-phosphate aminotransferase family protein [bacterium]